MASSDKDASCANDPDFAVICAFLEKFAEKLQVNYPDLRQLQDWLTNTDEVPNGLRDLHVKLMRKTRRTVHECAWESALSKFCFSYSSQDGWEIERFGYKKSSLKVKLRILRELLESQFDRNNKFRAKLLTMSADSLRSQPIGRDRLGHSYWLTQDFYCNLRIYQEHLDEEIWQVVATNRDELVKLISRLRGNEVVLPSEIGVVDEDSSSNSCSVPIVKPPPPEEKDESQESSQSIEGRIPNIKIKLGTKENGIVVNSESVINGQDRDEEKKVKPLVISHSKISMEKSKKRPLDELEAVEPEEIKKHRPSLLDSKREKKPSKYEKAKQEDDDNDDDDDNEDDDNDVDDDEDDCEEEEEEEEDEGDIHDEVEEEEDDEEDPEPEDHGEEEEVVEEVDKDDKQSKEEEKTNDPIVSEAIEDPVILVKEEGSGEECESFYDFLTHELQPDDPIFSEVIEETTLFVMGEGSGADSLVGNAKASEEEPKATFFFGQPGCLKLSPLKGQPKSGEPNNCNDEEKSEEEKSITVPANGENHSKHETDKEFVENFQEKKSLINRKRRLSEKKPDKRQSSGSETDLNSEIPEDPAPSLEEKEEDIGGKRLKMRSKLMNIDMRKKVEIQRNVGTVEETTSSSCEEDKPRKKVLPKRPEKEVDKILPLKAKLKQAALKENAKGNGTSTRRLCKAVVENDEGKEADVSQKDMTEELPSNNPINKQTTKPNSVEVDDDINEETPKKKLSPEQVSRLSVGPVKKSRSSERKTKSSETEKNNTPEAPATPTVLRTPIVQAAPTSLPEEHSHSENQRKRRSSGENSQTKECTPPPPVPTNTRSSRRSGPPPIAELPQPKRTRVKASNIPPVVEKKIEVKKEIPVEEDANEKIKIKVTARMLQSKSAIKQELPEEKPTLAEEKLTMAEEKTTSALDTNAVIDVKGEVELKIKEEPKPTKTLSKPITTPRPKQQAAEKQPASTQRRKKDDVDTKNIIDLESDTTPVRQSRRIAQLKIREEAERRKMEEIALRNMKAELKKKKKAEKADDPTVSEPSEHSSDHAESEVEIKKKEKKKKCPGKGGWSSGSEEPDEEEEQYETDPGSPLFRSDHEFSPESELEDESQIVPLKRARTARKEGDEVLSKSEADESCQKCGKSDHPEWILLCDKCDKGYHCSCLSPVIFYIPEGDWFCPPCQQEELIVALENHLREFDALVQRKKEEEEEKQRLEIQVRLEEEKAAQEKVEKQKKRKQVQKRSGTTAKNKSKNRTYRRKGSSDDDGDESEENGTETDASNSSRSNSSKSRSSKSQNDSSTDSDDEPIYKLRKRRQINVSYRLNEYDDMIKSALKEEEDEVAGAGNLGRGKDISTIIEADKEEKLRQQQQRIAEENGEAIGEIEKPLVSAQAAEESGSDFEPIKRKQRGGRHLKKKSRKLTTLDISSEGDNDSDEDFKTSSMDDEDDEDDDDEEDEETRSSDSSLEMYRRRRRGGRKNKKKTRRAARRAARERRKDRNFIVEDSDASDEVVRRPRIKKKRKDSDYTESETNDDDDDELSENIDSDDLCDDSTESEASDGAWRPSKRKKQRSSGIARKSPKLKPKVAPKVKKSKRMDDDSRDFKGGISKNRMIRDDSDDDDDADSVDSSRKTRGKRCMYLEDFEDESSDGGIKPGVKRPDTPPEEREKFIKKQEEIKRMLAEKNAEGAKLAATPRLIPIKSAAQKSPAKLDSLSTVPPSVIRQAKVLDIDYLQRKGESISEGDLDESEFDDDDLPDDFNPEDMDEEAIARMVEEEEDFAQQQQLKLPHPVEVLRKKPAKEMEIIIRSPQTIFPSQPPPQTTSSSASGLQEPVRKKLPMPTLHPPLLRHGYGVPSQHILPHNRSSVPTHLPLLQNALSAPINHPLSRNFPPTTQAIPATTQNLCSQNLGGGTPNAGDPNKPRGRRKKITPLRDPLQKQQAAAAASAAAAAASKPKVESIPLGKPETKPPSAPISGVVTTPGVIKSALSIAQPPQLYKPPPASSQPSVITRMPHLQGRPMSMPVGATPFSEQGSRFYRSSQPQQQPQQKQQPQQPHQSQTQQPPPPNALIPGSSSAIRHRGPPLPPMNTHHTLRTSYVGGPPPLRSCTSGPPIRLTNDIREQGRPRQPAPYSAPEQQYAPPPARHSAPPHLNPYRPQMYGSPGFSQRGPPPNSSQPSGMRPAEAHPEYSTPGSYVGGYGYYPPPPLSVPHSAPQPPTASAVPSSVIVSASSLAASIPAAPAAPPPTPPQQQQQQQQQPSAGVHHRPPNSSPALIEKSCAPTSAPVPVASTATTPSVIELTRKKLTTLETFNTSKTASPPQPLTESSESRSPYSSNPPTGGGVDDNPEDGSGSPSTSLQSTSEFSGLVSYFSSQHDDLNT